MTASAYERMGMDVERGRARTSGDERGRVGTGPNERGRARASGDERGQDRTNGDGDGRVGMGQTLVSRSSIIDQASVPDLN